MKLLFDQNISFRLIKLIADIYPSARQLRQVRLENATDAELFEFARLNDFTIVTFDSDFFDLNTLKGYPPKIIWIRTGNITTKNLESILRDKYELINLFIREDKYGCLEIDG